MKTTSVVLSLLCTAALSSCSTTQSPVNIAPATPPPAKKTVHTPAPPKADGVLGQVSNAPVAPPKPKAFPDIPLKEDTGVSPLIHTKPDTPSYKRSTP